MSLPYENASSGERARAEIGRILKRFGCSKIGFMDDYEEKTLLLAFKWRERDVQLRANWQGYANTWLRENPWSSRRHYGEREWEMRALEMGRVAVNSILRDWVKGQVTAIETGILTFEHVFMPYMMLPDGRSLGEHATKLLEGPQS